MEIPFKAIGLFSAVFLTGLSAGLFFAWSVSVIPGTQKVTDTVYLLTMQSINRAILNPAFFLIFFGSLVSLGLGSLSQWPDNRMAFWVLLAAFLLYLVGTLGVTGWGNVPLNDQLDGLDLEALSADRIVEFRKHYESKWNRFHLIRTAFAILAFLLSIVALFLPIK